MSSRFTAPFVPKPEKEEREKAVTSYDAIRGAAINLKNQYSAEIENARPEEVRYRRRIAIEVPGLSPAASAAMRTGT